MCMQLNAHGIEHRQQYLVWDLPQPLRPGVWVVAVGLIRVAAAKAAREGAGREGGRGYRDIIHAVKVVEATGVKGLSPGANAGGGRGVLLASLVIPPLLDDDLPAYPVSVPHLSARVDVPVSLVCQASACFACRARCCEAHQSTLPYCS